jgi:probable H4MPT-linked C1 transfer pathway protein
LGIDIGGANIKYADSHGRTHAVEFPLWLRADELADRLRNDLLPFTDCDFVAATMTGELADCFLDRHEGVFQIADALHKACQRCGLSTPKFYAVDGQFYDAEAAAERVDLVAAANWHALATWVATHYRRRGLLIDIGSTTTDLIPFAGGRVSTDAETDFDRLAESSLLYLGGQRTPVCSVVEHLSFRGKVVPVMREVFATMADARLLLGFLSAESGDLSTADGKPFDRLHSTNRIARMIGLDHRHVRCEDAVKLAAEIHGRAKTCVLEAYRVLLQRFGPFELMVVSGHAADLFEDVSPAGPVVRFQDEFGDSLSRCAPAYAVARLLKSRVEATCDAY